MRILVASDLSERSEAALGRAFRLARQHGWPLTLLHVVDEDLPFAVAQAQIRTAETMLGERCEAGAGLDCTIKVATGVPHETILAVADEVDAGLIVLGTHRHRAIMDIFTGSTVERLARRTLRPVLMVSKPAEGDYAQGLAGIDLSDAALAAVRCLARLAPEMPIATFHAVHVPFRGITAPHGSAAEVAPFVAEARRDLDAWLAKNALPETCSAPQLIPESVFAAFAETFREVKPDIVAIGAHGRASLAPTHLGSFAADLVSSPPSDLLILRRDPG